MARGIGEILADMGFVDEAEIEEALKIQRGEGGKIGDILIKLGYVSEPDVLFALAEQTGMEVADLDEEEVPPNVVDMVPKTFAVTYRVCPVGFEAGVLIVALADPMNPTVLDDLRFMLNVEIRGAVSTPDAVDRALAIDSDYADALQFKPVVIPSNHDFQLPDLSWVHGLRTIVNGNQ